MKFTKIIFDFFRDIGNFMKSRSVLGVDIGTTSIKIAELAKEKEIAKLVNYGVLETKEYLIHPNRIIQSSSLRISEKETAEMLKILLGEMKTKSRIAIGSIPAFAAFTTVLEMPVMSPNETKKAIDFQAPQYIPLPIKEVAVDWLKIGEYDTEQRQRYQRVLLIGIPNEIIGKYKFVFKEAGLNLVALELDGLAMLRSLLGDEAGSTLLVDLGSEISSLFLMNGENILYTGQTDYGGVYLTQAIAHSLGVSAIRAEELKKRRGLLAGGAESELSTLTQPFLDVIIQEVNHAKSTYESRYQKKVDRLMLTGGGANLLGIEKYFAGQVNVPMARPNIFRKVTYDLQLEPIIGRMNNEMPIAIGLAERYFLQ